jgi:uncharacterized membrane protein (DUF4010 family)
VSERGLSILICLATALTAGFVIGAERQQERQATFGGIRTFPLFALAGAIGALIDVWLLVGLGLSVGALLAVSYLRATDREHGTDDDLGLSTEVAALATFGLGALSTAESTGLPMTDRLLLVGGGATAVLGLLALKRALHDFVKRVSKDDVIATTKLLLLAVIVLPLLPSEDMGPWNALNPRTIGLLVVMISAIGFAGYVAIRVFGAKKGLGLTGLLGGLASSTAVTLTFSGRAKESPSLAPACAVAIVLASAVMFPRVVLVVAAVSPPLATLSAWPIGAAALVAFAAGTLLYFRLPKAGREGAHGDEPLDLKNPLTLSSAFKFAALFTGVLVISKAASTYLADAGVYLSAVVAGLADVDAITLSIARLQAQGSVSSSSAVFGIFTAIASNTVSKIGIAFVLGGRALGVRVAIALGAALAAGAVAAFVVVGLS